MRNVVTAHRQMCSVLLGCLSDGIRLEGLDEFFQGGLVREGIGKGRGNMTSKDTAYSRGQAVLSCSNG